jgi:hypothetical protein
MGLGGLTMFDDLHDPDPPTPGLDTLASVTARARQIRQHRVLMVCRAGVVGMIAIVAVATIPRLGRDDNDDTVVLVDPSTVTSTVAPTTEPTSTATDVPSVEPIPSTIAVSESTPATTLPPETTTTAPGIPSRSSITAIDGNGDAVLVEPDGTTTVLYNGVDPDDPVPSEGEVVRVNGVAASSDRSQAFISLCCEPVPGSIAKWPSAPGEPGDFVAYGNAAVLSPDGTLLAAVRAGDVVLLGLDGQQIAGLTIDPSQGSPVEVAFWNNDSLVVLAAGPERASLLFLGKSGDTFIIRNTVELEPPTSPTTARYSFADFSDQEFYVLDAEQGLLQTYNGYTGARLGQWDGAQFGGIVDATKVAFGGAVLRYVDTSRRLFVDGEQVPGEYIWVG